MISQISPVQVFPSTASQLYIVDEWFFPQSGTPTFNYYLQDSNNNNLVGGSCSMTSDQWNNWSTSTEDSIYILSCISINLNLTLTP